MVPFNAGYSLREAGSHFVRNLSTSLGAVVTIFLSLFIIGLFTIATSMINSVVGDVESRITIQAFLSDDADPMVVDALEEEIRTWNGVDTVTYKSKEEALAEYRATMVAAQAEDAVAALDGRNPIPASVVIRLTDAKLAEEVANEVARSANFIAVCDSPEAPALSVLYGAETVERLLTLTNTIRIVAAALVVLLIFVAFVFINNTIRLSIMARRTEIGIQRLVGASNSFIRGPFLMEGILQAIIGYVLAVIVLEICRHTIIPSFTESLQFLNFVVDDSVYLWIYLVLLVLAIIIGILGSMLAMRRYLKV
ncbi:MAG: permease-like cell division protein FtsX [Coriobacteriales bacterium]|nr:permease-like cell division protein FtsX [Coriobacteriales bacterium]